MCTTQNSSGHCKEDILLFLFFLSVGLYDCLNIKYIDICLNICFNAEVHLEIHLIQESHSSKGPVFLAVVLLGLYMNMGDNREK